MRWLTNEGDLTPRKATLLAVMVMFSGTLNVVLGLKLASLERSQRLQTSLKPQTSLTPVPRVKVGTPLEDIVGTDPSGTPVTIRFAGSRNPTVLLILRPGCAWCDKNMANWQALVREKSESFQFVTVSLSPLKFKEYIEDNRLPLPAVSPSFGKNPTLNDITGTPQTIVVGPDGIVIKVWFGAFTPDVKRDVETFFEASLPVAVQVPG